MCKMSFFQEHMCSDKVVVEPPLSGNTMRHVGGCYKLFVSDLIEMCWQWTSSLWMRCVCEHHTNYMNFEWHTTWCFFDYMTWMTHTHTHIHTQSSCNTCVPITQSNNAHTWCHSHQLQTQLIMRMGNRKINFLQWC